MTVEPHAAYTVCIRPVMPPKPAPRTLQPKLSMAEDAALVCARFRKTWGPTTARATADDANARRKQAAVDRRDQLATMALDLLSTQELTFGQMRDLCDASENQLRNALGYIRAQGMADFKRKGGTSVWHRVEVAAE